MKGAVVAKPSFVLSPESSERLFEILGELDAIFVWEDMGGEYFLSNAKKIPKTKVISICHIKEENYPLRFDEFVLKIAPKDIDVVITVGGDGIASYVATAIIRQQEHLPKPIGILGFPAGTANVGPIVQPNHSKKSLLKNIGLDAIEVSCAGKVLGYGFNDVIIGRTFLGTIDGKVVNLNARAMAERGEAVQDCIQESPVVSSDFKIFLNESEVAGLPHYPIKLICISTLHKENLYGRVVVGGLDEASGFKHPSAIALLDKVSTDARIETWGKKRIRNTAHLCFDEGDVVELAGFAKDASVIVDGNPFEIEGDSVALRCVPDAVLVYGNWR